jgi:diguanylate cyclase (GGDEF)-like protein
MTRGTSGGARRRSRGRLLLVGGPTVTPDLRARLAEPPVEVRTIFEAIGEITAVDTTRPIAAAIIPDEALGSTPPDVAGALRRIDPSVQIVRLRGANGGAAWAGADVCIDAPLDERAVTESIDETLLGADAQALATPTPDAPPRRVDASPPPPARAAIPAPPPPVPATPNAPPPLPETPEARDPMPDVPADRPEITEPPEPAHRDLVPDGELGDTDLVDAVLTNPDGVRTTALALIRQQTGWDDVTLRAEPPDGDGPAVEVRADHGEGAWLTSDRAGRGELAAWGTWLTRWMNLDGAYRSYRTLAYRDDLTGAWNRRFFRKFFCDTIRVARERRRPITVMVFDIDDFKRYNDQFDHAAGDVILCETVALLESVIRSCDRVCRIGGDEFAVIFADLDEPREAGSHHPLTVERIARRFQAQVCRMRFPKLGLEALGSLSISAGLATFPWDGNDPETLLRLADHRALESKRLGKNHITFGPDTAGDLDAP